jgi:hypothetical protein
MDQALSLRAPGALLFNFLLFRAVRNDFRQAGAVVPTNRSPGRTFFENFGNPWTNLAINGETP